MGRDWFHKPTGAGDGGGKSPSAAGTKHLKYRKKEKYTNNSSYGCMSAIYNLFDIQHHQFRFHHPSFVSESAIDDQDSSFCLRGIEAPRNSLESPESAMNAANIPSLSEVKEQTNLKIPVGRIEIETKRLRFTDDLSSETCNSPGIKTPNLIARLMGLDLLPEYSSPRPSSSSAPMNSHHRSRSLPATPRLSTASRRSTDNDNHNDYNHRLSLQVDKENCNSLRRSELLVRRQDDDRLTERISRRLGTDITNTMSPARSKYQRRDSNLDLLKPKRDELTPLSSLPKVKLLDINCNLNKPVSISHSSSIKVVKSKCRTAKFHRSPVMKTQENVVKDEKIKRIASERYDLRLKKMNQQENVFVSKKKSTALPVVDHVLIVKNTKKFRSFKNDMATSSLTPTRLSQKQVSLPSNLNSSYNSNVTHNLNAVTPTTTSGQYHQLEQLRQLSAVAATTRQTNKPNQYNSTRSRANQKPWNYPSQPDSCVIYGSDLIGAEVYDVVKRDIGKSTRRWLSTGFEAEVGGIAVEIEGEILGNLVHEIATETVEPAGSDKLSSHVTCGGHVIRDY